MTPPVRTRDRLEDLYQQFHHPRFLGSDPLQVVYAYADPTDRQIIGLIAALLAYGNVRAILGGIAQVTTRLTPRPHEYLLNSSPAAIERDFRAFRYRVTSGQEMAALLVGVRKMLIAHGDLHAGFAAQLRDEEPTVIGAMGRWVDELTRAAGHPLMHLLPHPSRGSACKRLCLYLRWMVRHDAIDPGGFAAVSPAKLVIPLDTHMHAMARRLRLTRRRTPTLPTAMDITAAFRRLCPDDPLRYDFCLTRPGILRVPM